MVVLVTVTITPPPPLLPRSLVSNVGTVGYFFGFLFFFQKSDLLSVPALVRRQRLARLDKPKKIAFPLASPTTHRVPPHAPSPLPAGHALPPPLLCCRGTP